MLMVPMANLMSQNSNDFLMFQFDNQTFIDCNEVALPNPHVLSSMSIMIVIDLDLDIRQREPRLSY